MDINERIAKLEKQNRWSKGCVLACAGITCIAIIMGADKRDKDYGPFRSIKAQRYIVVDEAGKERGVLGVDGDNSTELRLIGDSQHHVMHLSASNDSSSLMALDATSNTSVILKEDNGHVALDMLTKGVPRFCTHTKDEIALGVLDSSGNNRLSFTVYETGPLAGRAAMTIRDTANGELKLLP